MRFRMRLCDNWSCNTCLSKMWCMQVWSTTAVVLKLWYARAFQVVREQLSCHIRKALLIRFCVIIRSCVMLMLLIHLFAILILSTFWANYVLLKLGVYTPTLKKHQVVRDLKKFENHWTTGIGLTLLQKIFTVLTCVINIRWYLKMWLRHDICGLAKRFSCVSQQFQQAENEGLPSLDGKCNFSRCDIHTWERKIVYCCSVWIHASQWSQNGGRSKTLQRVYY